MGEPETTVEMTTDPGLGARIRQVRELRKLSLSTVAKKAEMSTAYLQKLEVGDVRQPSPRILYSLSQVLDIDYAELMRLTGYVVPNDNVDQRRRRNELTHALSSEELTDEEAQTLTEYLSWYRSRESHSR